MMDGEPFWLSVIEETYPERAKELRHGGEIPMWRSVDPQTELLAHILLELSDLNEKLTEMLARMGAADA